MPYGIGYGPAVQALMGAGGGMQAEPPMEEQGGQDNPLAALLALLQAPQEAPEQPDFPIPEEPNRYQIIGAIMQNALGNPQGLQSLQDMRQGRQGALQQQAVQERLFQQSQGTQRGQLTNTLLDHLLGLQRIQAAQDKAAGPDPADERQRRAYVLRLMGDHPQAGITEADTVESATAKARPHIERLATRDRLLDEELLEGRDLRNKEAASGRTFTQQLPNQVRGINGELDAAAAAARRTGASALVDAIEANRASVAQAAQAASEHPSSAARMAYQAAVNEARRNIRMAQQRDNQLTKVDNIDQKNAQTLSLMLGQVDEAMELLDTYGDIGGPVFQRAGLKSPDLTTKQVTAAFDTLLARLGGTLFDDAGKHLAIHELRLVGAKIPKMDDTLESKKAALRSMKKTGQQIISKLRRIYGLDNEMLNAILSNEIISEAPKGYKVY